MTTMVTTVRVGVGHMHVGGDHGACGRWPHARVQGSAVPQCVCPYFLGQIMSAYDVCVHNCAPFLPGHEYVLCVPAFV